MDHVAEGNAILLVAGSHEEYAVLPFYEFRSKTIVVAEQEMVF